MGKRRWQWLNQRTLITKFKLNWICICCGRRFPFPKEIPSHSISIGDTWANIFKRISQTSFMRSKLFGWHFLYRIKLAMASGQVNMHCFGFASFCLACDLPKCVWGRHECFRGTHSLFVDLDCGWRKSIFVSMEKSQKNAASIETCSLKLVKVRCNIFRSRSSERQWKYLEKPPNDF